MEKEQSKSEKDLDGSRMAPRMARTWQTDRLNVTKRKRWTSGKTINSTQHHYEMLGLLQPTTSELILLVLLHKYSTVQYSTAKHIISYKYHTDIIGINHSDIHHPNNFIIPEK